MCFDFVNNVLLQRREETTSYSLSNVVCRKTKNRYSVSHFEYVVDNHSVGSQWEAGVKYGEQKIVSKSEIIFDGERLELLLYAIEKDDKMDDIGEKIIAFSELEIGEEETVTEFVEVVENGGSAKGNTATWKFSVTVRRLS